MTATAIRPTEPTFADLCDDVRRAKVVHARACGNLKAAQIDADASYDALAKVQRALGEFCDRATDPS